MSGKNTKISEAAALAASLRQIADAQYTRRQRFNGRLPADVQDVLRMAADHLQGEEVPFGWVIRRPDMYPLFLPDRCAHMIDSFRTEDAIYLQTTVTPVYLHPQPAELAEQQGVWNDSARLACLESWAREPGGLLLHAESETGRRGLGLGENCGNRTLAQAIDGCATHAEKDSFAALAATGKQQVGEVLGDADIVSRMRNMLSDIEQLGAAPMTVDTNLIRDAIAALAARNPETIK